MVAGQPLAWKNELPVMQAACKQLMNDYIDLFPAEWLDEDETLKFYHTTQGTHTRPQTEQEVREQWRASVSTALDSAFLKASREESKAAAAERFEAELAKIGTRRHAENAPHLIPLVMALSLAEGWERRDARYPMVHKEELKRLMVGVASGADEYIVQKDKFAKNFRPLSEGAKTGAEEAARQAANYALLCASVGNADEAQTAVADKIKTNPDQFLTDYFSILALKLQQTLAQLAQRGQNPPPF